MRAGGCTSQRRHPQVDRLALQAPWHPRLLHVDVCESAGLLQQSKRLVGGINGISQCSDDFRHMELTGICRLTEPTRLPPWCSQQGTCLSRWDGYSDQLMYRLMCVKQPANVPWSEFNQHAEINGGKGALLRLRSSLLRINSRSY